MEGSLVAYKVFTNGSVLNASEINDNLMNQAVMVFSNSTTRAAALTAPVEGMLTWLEDVNRYEYRDGSGAWVVLGNSGLELIKTQTVGTAVASVPVTDVFSATYDQYRIILSGGAASGNISLNLKLGAASNGHNTALYFSGWGSSGSPTLAGGTNAANFTTVGAGRTTGLYLSVEVLNPFPAAPTTVFGLGESNNSTAALFNGLQTGNTSFTGFTISTATGTMTGGNIAVYGYRKA